MNPASAGASDEPVVQAYDSERFHCPYPNCKRSFAELWRLKVHYRAPPDVRGSGKERGHSMELTFCPKCHKELKPGKHHTGCRSSSRPLGQPTAKRSKQGKQPRTAGTTCLTHSHSFPLEDSRSSASASQEMRSSDQLLHSARLEPATPEHRRSSAPAQMQGLDEACDLAVPQHGSADPALRCKPPLDDPHATIPAVGGPGILPGHVSAAFAAGERLQLAADQANRKHALDLDEPEHEARSRLSGSGGMGQLHRQGSGGQRRYHQQQQHQPQALAGGAPLRMHTSLSRERFRRGDAWFRAFSEAASGSCSFDTADERSEHARERAALFGKDAAVGQSAGLLQSTSCHRFLSCPLPASHPQDSLCHLDSLDDFPDPAAHAPDPLRLAPAFRAPSPSQHQQHRAWPPRPQRPHLGLGSAYRLSGELGPGADAPVEMAEEALFNPFMEAARTKGRGTPQQQQQEKPTSLCPPPTQLSLPPLPNSLLGNLGSIPSLPEHCLGAEGITGVSDWAAGINPFAAARSTDASLMQLAPPDSKLDCAGQRLDVQQHDHLFQQQQRRPKSRQPQQQLQATGFGRQLEATRASLGLELPASLSLASSMPGDSLFAGMTATYTYTQATALEVPRTLSQIRALAGESTSMGQPTAFDDSLLGHIHSSWK